MNFFHSKDVLAVLPTRFGKSLLFQLIPGLCVELQYTDLAKPTSGAPWLFILTVGLVKIKGFELSTF